ELLGYASPTGLHARDLFRGVSTVRFTSPASAQGNTAMDNTPLTAAVEACLRDGSLFRRIEASYMTPAGKQPLLGITLSPVRNSKGESLGVAALISDLTEITALSNQIRVQENMAALGEMSAGIAHEFKNALATISGYAQMLRNDGGTTDE